MFKIGVIGYGGRIRDMLKEFLRTGEIAVTAVCDTDPAYARKNADENGVGEYAFYSDAREMLEKEALDGVLVGKINVARIIGRSLRSAIGGDSGFHDLL